MLRKYAFETTKQDLALFQRTAGSFEKNTVLHINKQEIL